jgi:hypothetical protein
MDEGLTAGGDRRRGVPGEAALRQAAERQQAFARSLPRRRAVKFSDNGLPNPSRATIRELAEAMTSEAFTNALDSNVRREWIEAVYEHVGKVDLGETKYPGPRLAELRLAADLKRVLRGESTSVEGVTLKAQAFLVECDRVGRAVVHGPDGPVIRFEGPPR